MTKECLEKLDFLPKIEACDEFYHRHIVDIPRIKFVTQRRGWAKKQLFKVAKNRLAGNLRVL